MTTHGATIQDRLALSLDKANQREAKARRPAAPAPAIPAERRCTKLSVSLFSGDMARLDSIRSYMASRGHTLTVSQAVKLALRMAPLTADMDKALDAIRAEDGRRW